jgi:small nuclear ribonucleoprotein (snRNP)-like protein
MAPKRQQRGPASLAVVLQALEGSRVIVELRRDTIVRGTLVSAEEGLGLHLTDASVKTVDGAVRQVASLHVRGSAVRFVHLPGNVDPAAAVEAARRKAAAARAAHAAAQGAVVGLKKGAPEGGQQPA